MMSEKEPEIAKEWAGYKAATLIVSIASVVIILAQGVYDHYYVERWKHIDYLSSELTQKRAELSRQELTPKLDVKINTLERAGVSSQLLSGMKAFPSTVEIKNIGGGTAHGIELDVASSERITQFQKWPALDPISITRVDGFKKLVIQADQIRKGSSVGVTLLTTNPPKIEFQGAVDVGDIIGSNDEDPAPRFDRSYLLFSQLPRELSFEKKEALVRDLEKETNPLKIRTRIMEQQIESLRSQSPWEFVSWNPVLVAFLLFIAGAIAGGLQLARSVSKERRKRFRGEKIVQEIKLDRFSARTLGDVLNELGMPDDMTSPTSDQADVELVYFSKYEWLSNSKGLHFFFKNHTVVKIENEYGYSIFDTALGS